MTFRFLAIVLLLLAAACTDREQPYPETIILDPFVVEPAGGRDVTMAGMKLLWHGPDGTLVDAYSPSAERVEIHTHQEVDGVMQMRRVEGIYVTSGLTLEFGPGGNHLMLFGFDEALAPGDSIQVTLIFETGDGKTREIEETFPLISLADTYKPSHH